MTATSGFKEAKYDSREKVVLQMIAESVIEVIFFLLTKV